MITKINFKDKTIKSYAIRKLTPFECFRLMGVRDAVIYIMQSTLAQAKERVRGWIGKGKDDEMAISASQQYKQAGNSIVVDALVEIYRQLIFPRKKDVKQQLDMFDMFFADDKLPDYPKGYDVEKGTYGKHIHARILTTFSGYDSQMMAADVLKEQRDDFSWECVGWSDIDKYACQMHDLVFPQYADKALGDITKIDWHKVKESLNGEDVDLFTYSSPCQDISAAGKQMGLKEGSNTRSALLWNVADAIEVLRPKYLLQENVAALVSEKFMPDFKKWLKRLEELGYVNRWALINAKDMNVPQNRLRVFCVSMRKDVAFEYEFPQPMPLQKKLADVLEDEVDEKYFLKDDAVSKFLKANDKDSALFAQFSLSPTHENAMFLKTFLTIEMRDRNLWDEKPTNLEKIINEELRPSFVTIYNKWVEGNVYLSEEFEQIYKKNMERTK